MTHQWFRSGEYTLLGHVHEGTSGRGVVIAPPFGWEEVCSYRPLRQMALELGQRGIATLRYDLPGTGDSTGGPRDAGLVQAWVASVGDGVAELRRRTGVGHVTVMGVGMGALVALAAARGVAGMDALILWGGAAKGRRVLRELRAFRNLEVAEEDTGSVEAPVSDGVEAGGFVLTVETVADLEALDVAVLSGWTGRRVLVLSRDELPVDRAMVSVLKSAGAVVEQRTGVGWAAMMAVPHEARMEPGVSKLIGDWVLAGPAEEGAARVLGEEAFGERIVTLPNEAGQSFGIVTPAQGNGLWLLLLNPGAGRHIGPNRMWVEMAREWAKVGVPSLRMDLAGIGESDGAATLDTPALYEDGLVEEIERAMEYLRREHGARSFTAVGLCSGAFWAFHAAARNADVRAAILVNPRLFFWDPEVDRRRERLRNRNAVSDAAAWKRLVKGQVSPGRIKSALKGVLELSGDSEEATQIPAARMAETLGRIRANGTRLSMLFSEGEPLLAEMEEEGFLGPGALSCERMAGAGHTFRPRQAQARLREWINGEIAGALDGQTAQAGPVG